MTFISELERLSGLRIIAYVTLLSACFCPGILFLFLFQRQIFFQLETSKLLALSFALTLPLIVLNTLCMRVFFEESAKSEKEASDHVLVLFMMGGLVTMAIYSIAVLAGYYWPLNSSGGVRVVLVCQSLLVLLYIHHSLFPRVYVASG